MEAVQEDSTNVVLSVAELARKLKRVVEEVVPNTWVEGEVSSLKTASSGHLYFSLKDEREEALLDCVMYRAAALRGTRIVRNGARVQVRTKATFWVPRGRLQLIADAARLAGRGSLLEALERLKQQLATEGLFDPIHKRPLPKDPKVIGVVTSAAGAAIHDIVKVSFQRGPVRIVLSPALVQGSGAPAAIIQALTRLEAMPGIDAIIIGRGGGASEDLAAFNDEQVVRRVAACPVPIISAVGHEIDTSLTDLVADARAATPSHAAEMLVPDERERKQQLRNQMVRLHRAIKSHLSEDLLALSQLHRALGDPKSWLSERRQLLDDFDDRMQTTIHRRLHRAQTNLLHLNNRLSARHPQSVVEETRGQVREQQMRLTSTLQRRLAKQRSLVREMAGKLSELSPLVVLARGYCIAMNEEGEAIRHSSQTKVGDRLELRLNQGRVQTQVHKIIGPGEE
jgi:exodeoxyribonuclease VII large subunit